MVDVSALKKLAEAQAEVEDQSVVQEFTAREPIPQGRVMLRLREYLEFGVHPGGEYMGKKKPDAPAVELVFEVVNKKYLRTFTNDAGEEVTIAPTITVREKKKQGAKAGFVKLFRAMAHGRSDIKHIAQMLTDGFMGTVVHNEYNGRIYENLKTADGVYTIGAPRMEKLNEDGEVESVAVPIPELVGEPRLFLWDQPTKECWDSLYIAGDYERTVKGDDGEEKKVRKSKNFLQEKCLSALNFEGSPLQQMLYGMDDLPTEEVADDKVVDDAAAAGGDGEDDTTGSAAPAADNDETSEADGTVDTPKEADKKPASKPKGKGKAAKAAKPEAVEEVSEADEALALLAELGLED